MGKRKEITISNYYFYVKQFIGYRFFVYIFLNILIGLLDSIGLALFIPLLALATNSEQAQENLGNLDKLIDAFHFFNVDINLLNVLLMMVIIFCIKGMFYYLKGLYLNRTLLIALKKIRYQLIDGLKFLSYEGYTKLDAGRVQNTMVAQTGQLMGNMNSYFMTIQNLVLCATYIAMAFYANWEFAIMVALGGVLTNFLYKIINKLTKKYATAFLKIGHDFTGRMMQVLNNYKYLKATGKFSIFEKKLKQDIEITENVSFKMGVVGSVAEALREPMVIAIICLVLFLQVQVLDNAFSSTMIISLMLFYRSLTYLISLQSMINHFIKSSVAVNDIEKLINEMKDLREVTALDQIIQPIDTLKVNNVSLTYGDKTILKNINLEIPSKTSIALVGESGAGKTTLANVISGLIKPHVGAVLNDNIDVFANQLNDYRNKIGYITQEAVVFDDTLFNNITLWSEKTAENLKKFEQTLELVALDDFYHKLSQKEDTYLGNNGILVSGGQKQRISIARELYRDIELLILDEATSALDSETEKIIQDSIDILKGRFTMIIIAHRLSTIKNVDQIYLMNNGEVVAHGNYEDLIQKSDRFKKMTELQRL